jgi:curli biogenesis system outer membrane secretion channel CsgG
MKIKTIVLLMLAFGFSQSKINKITEEKERLLVLSVDRGEGAQSIESTVTSLVSSEAVNLTRFEVIDRNQLERILSEQKLQMSGIIREDEVVRYGEVSSADEALIVSILSFGQKGVPPKESMETISASSAEETSP